MKLSPGPASRSRKQPAATLSVFSSDGITALPALFTRVGLRDLLDAPYSGSVERWDLSNYKFAITIDL